MPKIKKKGVDKLAVQNAAKTLLANIRFANVDKPVQSITVTSSVPNEGKSTVALNLAQAIATSGASVCLVECDMRRRSVADMIGVRTRGGIYAVLSEHMTLDEAVVETNQKNLFFLDAEPHIPNPADIIASRRFSKLVSALEGKFRYVVFDTPPVGTFVDAAEVGQLSDGVVFVVRENFAKRNEVLAAFDQLRKAEVNIIGTVMNYCEAEINEYYYAYYTKEGKRAQSPSAEEGGSDSDATALPTRKRTAAGVQPIQPVQGSQVSASRFSR
ncbi:MAG: CpsD/CapB family tyrosine-protein kinase [Collinsella sp.]|nr:CpsD/CapB family tyrosine-protein kinase [Collinsella sp.]